MERFSQTRGFTVAVFLAVLMLSTFIVWYSLSEDTIAAGRGLTWHDRKYLTENRFMSSNYLLAKLRPEDAREIHAAINDPGLSPEDRFAKVDNFIGKLFETPYGQEVYHAAERDAVIEGYVRMAGGIATFLVPVFARIFLPRPRWKRWRFVIMVPAVPVLLYAGLKAVFLMSWGGPPD